MPSVSHSDLERMRSAVFIDGPLRGRPSSRFWILLLLAAVIATAGLVGDSVATVIGAMIVAPLMTPILGFALGIVLADRNHVVRSALYIVGGALVVIAVGFALSVVFSPPDLYESNSQVAARISPHLIDLVAALATGLVGAFALVRSDVSDTLPGVAIAISLVPPLAVVGMLLQVGRYNDAAHAMLLFGTNVAAIIATGAVILVIYDVRGVAVRSGLATPGLSMPSLVAVVVALLVIAVPLAIGSATVVRERQLVAAAQQAANKWVDGSGWTVRDVSSRDENLVITLVGSPPQLDPSPLRAAMNEAGYGSTRLSVVSLDGTGQVCPADSTTCGTAFVAQH